MTSYLDLKWLEFPRHLASWSSRLLADTSSYDLWLKCSDGVLGAHRLVLTSCSTFFSETLGGREDFLNSNSFKPLVVLWDTLAEDVRLLLRYMYVGEVRVEEANLVRFLELATKLKVKGLTLTDEENNSSGEAGLDSTDGSAKIYQGIEATKVAVDMNASVADATYGSFSQGSSRCTPSDHLDKKSVILTPYDNMRSRQGRVLVASNFDYKSVKQGIARDSNEESNNNVKLEQRDKEPEPSKTKFLKNFMERDRICRGNVAESFSNFSKEESTDLVPVKPSFFNEDSKEAIKSSTDYDDPLSTSTNGSDLSRKSLVTNDPLGKYVNCEECGKVLLRKSKTAHMTNCHSGKTFTCEPCNKNFKSLKSLKDHKQKRCPERYRNWKGYF